VFEVFKIVLILVLVLVLVLVVSLLALGFVVLVLIVRGCILEAAQTPATVNLSQ
jgi:hypothetical protein